ncbi:MAG: hypothetical protein NZ481_09235 [Candidatus Kapabacteria bacterium]|nr:hypothetical protein [Candidatus Kapabacteria bacterium]
MRTVAVSAPYIARVGQYLTVSDEIIDLSTPYAKITSKGDQLVVELSDRPKPHSKREDKRRNEWQKGTRVGKSWTWKLREAPAERPLHGYYHISKQENTLIFSPLQGWPVTWRYLPSQRDAHLLIPSATRTVFHPLRWDVAIEPEEQTLVLFPTDHGPYRRAFIRIPAALERWLPPGRWWLFGVVYEEIWLWNKRLSGLET